METSCSYVENTNTKPSSDGSNNFKPACRADKDIIRPITEQESPQCSLTDARANQVHDSELAVWVDPIHVMADTNLYREVQGDIGTHKAAMGVRNGRHRQESVRRNDQVKRKESDSKVQADRQGKDKKDSTKDDTAGRNKRRDKERLLSKGSSQREGRIGHDKKNEELAEKEIRTCTRNEKKQSTSHQHSSKEFSDRKCGSAKKRSRSYNRSDTSQSNRKQEVTESVKQRKCEYLLGRGGQFPIFMDCLTGVVLSLIFSWR